MIPGIMAGQMRVAAGGGTLWTPLNMATVPQIYLDAQDSVVTDVSGACSAISNLGAMGANGDFSQTTSGSRPTILAAELNGKRVLRFDGTDDHMLAASAAGLFRNAPAAWLLVVYKKRLTDASDTWRVLLSCATGTGGTRFSASAGTGIGGGKNAPTVQGRRLDGDSLATLASATLSSGAYVMALHNVDFSTREGRIYLNGASVASNATLTAATGSTSDTDSASAPALGATATGGVPADADVACAIISNTQPSATDIDKLFGWAAHKYGLTANLPAGHPYKTVAPTV